MSTPSPLQPPAGPCHTVRQPQAREERLPQADGREKRPGEGVGGPALPCPGARERERERGPMRSSVDQRMRGRRAGRWRLEAQQRGEGTLLLRRGRCRGRGRGGGDLLGALPVLLCSRAWAGSGTRAWGRGLGGARSRSRGRTGTLGVVHVLGSGPGVRLPVGVVVLFRRREWTRISGLKQLHYSIRNIKRFTLFKSNVFV